MAEDNGEKKPGLIGRIKDDAKGLKQYVSEKGKEQLEGLKEPEKSQVFRSIFRVKHDDQPRNRALSVLSNVFFHLHPAKVNRDAVKYNFTWGMGGITMYLFMVLTFTGVLLMFYYHPTKVQAFRDILYLENDVPFGKLLRNMHRWAAHMMVITVGCTCSVCSSLDRTSGRANSTGALACCFWCSRCCFHSRVICCRTTSSDSGPSRWERIWREPLRCLEMKDRSARYLG